MTLSQTLARTLPKPQEDPWLAMFQQHGAPPESLLALLQQGLIPLTAERAGALLKAFLDRYVHEHGGLTREEVSQLPAFPSCLEAAWPAPVNDAQADEHLAGRLWAASTQPMALGIELRRAAMYHDWQQALPVLLAQPWPWEGLSGWQHGDSDGRPKGDSAMLWPHALAKGRRLPELQAWLAYPGHDPNLPDALGRSPLFYARASDTVEVLMRAGADAFHRAANGDVALAFWERSRSMKDSQEMIAQVQHWTPDILDDVSVQWADFGTKVPPPHAVASAVGHTLPIVNAGVVEAWGLWGVMALRLDRRYLSPEIGQEWYDRIQEAPSALAHHESIPGLPDLWLFEASWLAKEAWSGQATSATAALAVRLDAMFPAQDRAARLKAVFGQTLQRPEFNIPWPSVLALAPDAVDASWLEGALTSYETSQSAWLDWSRWVPAMLAPWKDPQGQGPSNLQGVWESALRLCVDLSKGGRNTEVPVQIMTALAQAERWPVRMEGEEMARYVAALDTIQPTGLPTHVLSHLKAQLQARLLDPSIPAAAVVPRRRM